MVSKKTRLVLRILQPQLTANPTAPIQQALLPDKALMSYWRIPDTLIIVPFESVLSLVGVKHPSRVADMNRRRLNSRFWVIDIVYSLFRFANIPKVHSLYADNRLLKGWHLFQFALHCAEYESDIVCSLRLCLEEHDSHITWSIRHAVYTPPTHRTSQFYFQKMWNSNELAIIWINPGSICWNYYCLLFCKWDGS